MRRRCCKKKPPITSCTTARALLATLTSVDVTIVSKNGSCTGCSAAWTGSYNLTPAPGWCPGGWEGCFRYAHSGTPVLSCRSPTYITFQWACNLFPIPGLIEFVISGTDAGVWRRQISLPASYADLTSGTLPPDALSGICLPDGDAHFQLNF